MTLKFKEMGKEVSKEMVVKQGAVKPLDITPTVKGVDTKLVDYEFYVTNYEFTPSDLTGRYPKKDGDLLVMIQILGEKGATKESPIKAGTYNTATPADGAEVASKAWHVVIKYFEEGKMKTATLAADTPQGARKGFVKINSVADGVVKGEIDISDDFGSVKGAFSAKATK